MKLPREREIASPANCCTVVPPNLRNHQNKNILDFASYVRNGVDQVARNNCLLKAGDNLGHDTARNDSATPGCGLDGSCSNRCDGGERWIPKTLAT